MPTKSFNPTTSFFCWDPPRDPTPYVRVLQRYVALTENWDLESFMGLFDDSLQHWTLPISLNRPVLNKRQYGEYLKVIRPTFKIFKMTVNEVIEAENKLCVHAFLKAESVKGTPLNGEYVLIFHFVPHSEQDDQDALPKICIVKEFIDSAASTKYYLEEKKQQQPQGQSPGAYGFK